jgi:hypothetical protein
LGSVVVDAERAIAREGIMGHKESRVGWAGLSAAFLATLTLEIGYGSTDVRVPSARVGAQALRVLSPDSVLFVGAGDVGDEGHHSEATYSLIRRIFQSYGGSGCAAGDCATQPDGGTARGRVFVAGDNAYPDGTAQNFVDHYSTTWGQLIRNSWPAIGNHEYADYARRDANGYFDFFGGSVAGFPQASPAPLNRPDGWYAYDWGQWKIAVLNSNCNEVNCAAQNSWLQGVLAASVAGETSGNPKCQLVYAHHPRFSDCLPSDEGGSCPGSGDAGGASKTKNPLEKYLWNTMYDYGVDVFVSGHDHGYQRFPRFNKVEPPAQENQGVRQYVVGSGGKDLYGFDRAPLPARLVQGYNTFGVVSFELNPASYRSAFRPASAADDPEWDVTETSCHGSNVPLSGLRPDDGSALYQGCFEDRSDRALPDNLMTSPAMTPSSCRSRCAANGKSYAGVQYGSECWCGNTNPANASPPYALKTGECTMPCSGNAAVACGGSWRNSVYRTGINRAPGGSGR